MPELEPLRPAESLTSLTKIPNSNDKSRVPGESPVQHMHHLLRKPGCDYDMQRLAAPDNRNLAGTFAAEADVSSNVSCT